MVELFEAGYKVVACDNLVNSVNGEKDTALLLAWNQLKN